VRALITGAAGMLGRNLAEEWRSRHGGSGLITLTRADGDLRDREFTRDFIAQHAPDVIIHAAARVNGIAAKLAHPVTYLLENLQLDTNVIEGAIDAGVPSLVYVGSAAVYPEKYTRPYTESDLLSGPLEPANEGYALAKLAGIKLCEYAAREHGLAYRAILPSNLYGVHDHFEASSAHLVASAIKKVHDAAQSGADEVVVWGDGTARREFAFAGDVAAWVIDRLERVDELPSWLNLGSGVDFSVAEYYEAAARTVGFRGTLRFDTSKPSGVPRRLLDSGAARALGWNPPTSIEVGFAAVYDDFVSRYASPGRNL
jgi:GDP-L-fucose synthase